MGVGVGVGASEVEESVGAGSLLVFGGALVEDVGVGVGVDEEIGADVLLSVAEADVPEDVVAAPVPNNAPPRPFTAELMPSSRSFFSTTSRRKGFELNQLACARARKRVIRVNTRNCCRENIFAMVCGV